MARNEVMEWNKVSSIYDIFMRKDMPAYREVINRIRERLESDSRVLEIATGTGIISLGIAGNVKRVEAMDISPDMIAESEKKAKRIGISNVHFFVQDAYTLPYDAESFDVIIIANALHIMSQPEKALAEIKRILTKKGYLIAPTFVHSGSKRAAFFSRLMSFIGFRAYHRWTKESYCQFLNDNGFLVKDMKLLTASFPLAYVVSKKRVL